MSYLRNSRKKIKKIIRMERTSRDLHGKPADLTMAQKQRLITWMLVESEKP